MSGSEKVKASLLSVLCRNTMSFYMDRISCVMIQCVAFNAEFCFISAVHMQINMSAKCTVVFKRSHWGKRTQYFFNFKKLPWAVFHKVPKISHLSKTLKMAQSLKGVWGYQFVYKHLLQAKKKSPCIICITMKQMMYSQEVTLNATWATFALTLLKECSHMRPRSPLNVI